MIIEITLIAVSTIAVVGGVIMVGCFILRRRNSSGNITLPLQTHFSNFVLTEFSVVTKEMSLLFSFYKGSLDVEF